MVADLPCFSVVINYALLLLILGHVSTSCNWPFNVSFNFYLFPDLFVDLSIIFAPFKGTILFLQISQLVREFNAFISITMIHLLRLFARRSVTVSVTTLMNTVTVQSS